MGSEKPDTGNVSVELCYMDAGKRRILKDLLSYCDDVTSFLIHVICDHLEEILALNDQSALTRIEQLVHHTKDNPLPEYMTFDKTFPRLPSNIRRACIHSALGHVKSHETRCDQYYEARQAEIDRGHHYKKMEPKFTYMPNVCPTLYRKQSFKLSLFANTVEIKILINGVWQWMTCKIPNRDAKYLIRAMQLGVVMNPKLVFKYNKFYLQFPVKYRVASFPNTPLEKQTVFGVDLGFNSPAVGSVVDYYGSVRGRIFAPFKEDMARINHIINLIRKAQRTSGKGQSLSSLYTKLQGLKENFVKQLAHWIVEMASRAGVYGIALEHLSSIHRGKCKGSLKARVHNWCVAKIRDFVKGLAFRKGIRVFLINPWGTSMYAYDGSGKTIRDESNYSVCTFQSGKRYNCDLSASYNIAARYFLRAVSKSISAKEWSALKAKVPELPKRTMWTLSTLRSVASTKTTSPQKACVT